MQDISKTINNYFATENYSDAKKLLLKKIDKEPNEHWNYAQLSISYYETKEYETALKYSTIALELEPNCPLSLDYHASILFAKNNFEVAEQIWTDLLNKDINILAYGDCGEGLKQAKSIKNDIRCILSDLYVKIDKKEKAIFLLKEHLNNRQRGIYSNYTKKEVKKELKKLEQM